MNDSSSAASTAADRAATGSGSLSGLGSGSGFASELPEGASPEDIYAHIRRGRGRIATLLHRGPDPAAQADAAARTQYTDTVSARAAEFEQMMGGTGAGVGAGAGVGVGDRARTSPGSTPDDADLAGVHRAHDPGWRDEDLLISRDPAFPRSRTMRFVTRHPGLAAAVGIPAAVMVLRGMPLAGIARSLARGARQMDAAQIASIVGIAEALLDTRSRSRGR